MSPTRLFILLATVLGLAHAAITPPLRVPDEVTHFWRAVSVSRGTLVPKAGPRGAVAPFPKGYQDLAFVYLVDAKITRDDLRVAYQVPLREMEPVDLPFIADYTPVAYTPQILVAAVAKFFHARPFFVFYLGRLAALAAYITMIAFAIRITPAMKWGFVAAGLLPMSLSLAASWSADAMAISVAFLLTAALLRAYDGALVLAFLLGLVKPGYFLISALGAAKRKWLPLVAAISGSAIAAYAASLFPAPSHGNRAMQWICIRSHPLETLGIVLRDYGNSAFVYLEEMIGRLGMLDVFLPMWAVWTGWILLLVIVLTSGDKIERGVRITALLATIVTLLGISLTLYVTWTSPCAEVVEGIQGRYFLPVLPMAMIALSNPWAKGVKLRPWLIGAALVVINVAGLVKMFAAAY